MHALFQRHFAACPLVAIIRGVRPDEAEAVGDAIFEPQGQLVGFGRECGGEGQGIV